MTKPAMRIERPECEPPPTGTMSVSPWISRTALERHAEPVADTHCAKLVSWPWPLASVPITTSTSPDGSTVTSARSRGLPSVSSM